MKLDLAREIVQAIVDDDPTDACAPALATVLAELDRRGAELAQAASALVLCRWLITLDDPEDVQGREDRRTVTLTQICNKAREALGRVGEYPPSQPD